MREERPVDRVAAALPEPAAARWFRAPGRVNLMGDHTDYNEGFVLPIAIDRACVAAARPREDVRVRVRSLDVAADEQEVDVAADGSDEPAELAGWARYVAGVVRALAEHGRPAAGVDAVLSSSVPSGSGLSSSAALEVALALALSDAAAWELPERELALACQRGEQVATGVPSGIMDQLASISGRDGCALLVDCRSLDIRAVPVPEDVGVLVVHSGVRRELGSTAYAERRAECEALARELGLRALRDATPEQVRGSAVGRHVVGEDARVLECADALAAADLDRLGRLYAESHASLRDDFGVSTPELDALVEELVGAGALGARLTGAGFGGCVVALCRRAEVAGIAETATARYRERTGREPTPLPCRAVAGAARFEP